MSGSSDSPTLSVIVPVYGVEPYLRRCVDSVLSQTLSDLECILVDDGSPDGCGAIVDEYAAADPRVVAIHQENRGVSAARNAGLAVARGTYVGFADPDDWVEPEMYAALVGAMREARADLAACGFRRHCEDGSVSEHVLDLPGEMSARDFALELFSRPRTVGGSTCNKVFLRELIVGGFDESVSIMEDNLFVGNYLVAATKACVVPKALYDLFERPDSATRRSMDCLRLCVPSSRELIDVVSPLGECVMQGAETDFIDTCLRFLATFIAADDRESARYVRSYLRSYSKEHLSDLVSNSRMHIKLKVLWLAAVVGLWP